VRVAAGDKITSALYRVRSAGQTGHTRQAPCRTAPPLCRTPRPWPNPKNLAQPSCLFPGSFPPHVSHARSSGRNDLDEVE